MHKRPPRPDHLGRIAKTFAEFVEIYRGRRSGMLGLHISSIHGRRIKMAALPPLRMLDVEKVLLSVAPQKANGDPDTEVTVSWTSSAPEQVGVEPSTEDNGRSAWALTPLERGAATITVSAPGYETDTLEIAYEPAVAGKLNLSAGTPVPE